MNSLYIEEEEEPYDREFYFYLEFFDHYLFLISSFVKKLDKYIDDKSISKFEIQKEMIHIVKNRELYIYNHEKFKKILPPNGISEACEVHEIIEGFHKLIFE